MKSIRRSVFETNSSSTHSVSISKGDLIKPNIANLDELNVSFGEYGWEYEEYCYWENKLSYLLTMVLETEAYGIETSKDTWIEEFKELDGYKLLDETIYSVLEAHISLEHYRERDEKYKCDLGYIDHQSCEDYGSLSGFLEYNGISAYDFIFNDGVYVITDNDNH